MSMSIFLRRLLRIIPFFLFTSITLFSCATLSDTLSNVQISYVLDDTNPLKDDSFPVQGEAAERKVQFIEAKRETVADYLNEKKILPFSLKFGKEQLSCYGELYEVTSTSSVSEKVKPVVNKLFFNSIKKKYVWNGFTEYEETKYDTKFYVTVSGSGEKRRFKVKTIDSGSISMKVHNAFGYIPVDTPCKVASVSDHENNYNVYACVNKNYRAFGKDSVFLEKVKRNTPKISTRELFNLKGQRFQITDQNNTVLAESSMGKYKIYLSEEDPRHTSLMQTVALIETYRNVMNKIDSIKPLEK